MSALRRLVQAELGRPAPEAARLVAASILRQRGDSVCCILFYGSRRRDAGADGLLDLYVLFDRSLVFHRGRVAAAVFNRLLPPNVLFVRVPTPDGPVQAKVAVMSRGAFAARMRPSALDTTLWTRFCQPSSMLYARDQAVADWTVDAIAEGIRTARGWAARSAPGVADAADHWRALFARTYRLELRPEANQRATQVHDAATDWFAAISAAVDTDRVDPVSGRSWLVRKMLGKPLNVLRLIKAAFTFEGGADYLAGKLGKHTGITLVPTPWQRRHPLLGAPGLLFAHRRQRCQAQNQGARSAAER